MHNKAYLPLCCRILALAEMEFPKEFHAHGFSGIWIKTLLSHLNILLS